MEQKIAVFLDKGRGSTTNEEKNLPPPPSKCKVGDDFVLSDFISLPYRWEGKEGRTPLSFCNSKKYGF